MRIIFVKELIFGGCQKRVCDCTKQTLFPEYKSIQAGRLTGRTILADRSDAELTGIVRFAYTAASLSAQKPGGITSVPDLAEVEPLMA